MFSTTMINDIHSWPKEIKHHIGNPGSELPFNAVAVLMHHQGCSEAEAIARMREKQAELQDAHLELLRNLEATTGPIPEHHMLYILAAQYAASGSEFWSIYVPRYPSKNDLCQPEVEFVNGTFKYVEDDGTSSQGTFCSESGKDEHNIDFKNTGTSISVVEIAPILPSAGVKTKASQDIIFDVVEIRPKVSVGNMRGTYASAVTGRLEEHAKGCASPSNDISRPAVSKKTSMPRINKKASTRNMAKTQINGHAKYDGCASIQMNKQHGRPVTSNGTTNGQSFARSINSTASSHSHGNRETKDAGLDTVNGNSLRCEGRHRSKRSKECTDEVSQSRALMEPERPLPMDLIR